MIRIQSTCCALSLAMLCSAATAQEPDVWIHRCGAPEANPQYDALLPPSDCAYSSTNPDAAYDPVEIWEIPVVFHVNDSINPQKVTYNQIQSAINILNEDFNGNNPEFNSLDPLFQNIAANIGITFCLASQDLSGLPTTR